MKSCTNKEDKYIYKIYFLVFWVLSITDMAPDDILFEV